MLATGRALMTNPRIVPMDEPSMGLSPLLVKEILAIIEELHKSGITILLVGQNAKMTLAVSGGHDITRKLSQQLGEDGCVELIRKLLPLFT